MNKSKFNLDIKKFFFDEDRTTRVKRNIFALGIFKGLSIIISLILVPLMIKYLNPTGYGIWLTLNSIVGWLVFFDVGLGNGLRNKLIEALAKGEKNKAKVYVSTTYSALIVVAFILLIVFIIINPYLNWSKILNTDSQLKDELSVLASIVFSFLCIRFVLGLLNIILIADQKPASANFLELLGNTLFLLSVLILYFLNSSGSLIWVGLTFGISTTIVLLLATIGYFKNKYGYLKPDWSYININSINELLGVGVQFFIIQLAYIAMFMTGNLIIAQLFGPSEVTTYNIAFKFFSIITMGFTIVLTPFWSAFGDAYHRGEIQWIKNTMKRLLKMWILFVIFTFLMLVFSNYIYLLWIGKSVIIPLMVSAMMALNVTISNWNSIFAYFINGTGKIRLQLYSSIFIAIINVPLSIFFGKYLGIGISGVILASCVCLMIGAIWAPTQYLKIISGKDKGIWGK